MTCVSSPTRTRTWNKPVNSRLPAERNPLPTGTSGDPAPALARGLAHALSDPDLQRIIDAWPVLPDHIRQAVLALVGTAS